MSRTMLSSVNDAAQTSHAPRRRTTSPTSGARREDAIPEALQKVRAARRLRRGRRGRRRRPVLEPAAPAAAAAAAGHAAVRERPDAAARFYGLAWWLPCCATYRTEGLTARPAAALPVKKEVAPDAGLAGDRGASGTAPLIYGRRAGARPPTPSTRSPSWTASRRSCRPSAPSAPRSTPPRQGRRGQREKIKEERRARRAAPP